jgi:chemotaxis protein MotB
MKKRVEKHANHERWLLTYSDLITLLMIFFVVMYASSNVDTKKYQQISDSFRLALGSGASPSGTNILTSDTPVTLDVEAEKIKAAAETTKLNEVKQKVDTFLKGNQMEGSVSTNIEDRGLVISLKDTVIFDNGKADIKPEIKPRLIELGKFLNQLDNFVRVEGHTDSVAMHSYQFDTNWELSAVRATNVIKMLIAESAVVPKRLSAVGYGEFRPVGDNSTEVGRTRNRRVDIIIMDSKFDQVENNKK